MNSGDMILSTAKQVADAVGVSIHTARAVKKASSGTADNPFAGRYTTANRFSNWVFANPEFVANSRFKRRPWHG